MSRPSRRSGALVLSVAALVAATALSGCGVADEGISPGVAAEVGDTQITIGDLDEAVDGACSYFTETGTGTAIPRGDVRDQLLQLLVKRAAAEQMLEANDAELDPGYEAAVTDNETQLAEATAAQRDGVLTGSEADIYYQAAVLGAGADLLAAEGVTEIDGAAALERGERALTEWIADHEIEVNPLFGVIITDGEIALASAADLSVAAGDFAQLGEAEAQAPQQPVREEYAASLPADQTCG